MGREDLHRIVGNKKTSSLLKQLLLNHNFRIIYCFRKAQKSKVFSIAYFWLSRKYNIEVSKNTKIGEGLFLNHRGGVIINPMATLGKNINIEPRVVIGQQNRGKRQGTPTIGNEVWIGANSVIVGKIKIGDNVLISPNSYVNFDVPNNSVVMGNPGKIIPNDKATKSYISRKV